LVKINIPLICFFFFFFFFFFLSFFLSLFFFFFFFFFFLFFSWLDLTLFFFRIFLTEYIFKWWGCQPQAQHRGPRCPFCLGHTLLTLMAWKALPVATLPPVSVVYKTSVFSELNTRNFYTMNSN